MLFTLVAACCLSIFPPIIPVGGRYCRRIIQSGSAAMGTAVSFRPAHGESCGKIWWSLIIPSPVFAHIWRTCFCSGADSELTVSDAMPGT